jgi:dienelactone hydrolase
MHWVRLVVAAAIFVGPVSRSPAAAGPYIEVELRVPFAPAGPRSLEALLVRPNEPGRYPLALIAHGSPRSVDDHPNMSPWAMLPQAIEFARRGWAAVVVMRRGYGGSGGDWAEGYGSCANPNYIAAGTAAAADLKAAITFLVRRPDIDPSRVISVGVSAGGFATVALAADPPRELVAAISFAGGRGSTHDDNVCRKNRLIKAFRFFGKRARMPMLWVYAENDHFFGPRLAQQLKDAFTENGASAEFIAAPAFGNDGHRLFSMAGIPVWTGFVDAFLREHDLKIRATLLPPPARPALAVPRNLSTNGRNAFETYLMSAPHKAFALSPEGHFGWRSGQRTTDAARSGALEFCRQNAENCDVMFVDDAAMSQK